MICLTRIGSPNSCAGIQLPANFITLINSPSKYLSGLPFTSTSEIEPSTFTVNSILILP